VKANDANKKRRQSEEQAQELAYMLTTKAIEPQRLKQQHLKEIAEHQIQIEKLTKTLNESVLRLGDPQDRSNR
jgi:acid phosphatase family membrane protein YuiD